MDISKSIKFIPLPDLKKLRLDFDEIFRVMSFNIHREESDPEHDWEDRKEGVASIIRFHHPDLVGLQEPFKVQLDDLRRMLPEFDQYGIGLEDGREAGPHDSILFRFGRFTLLDCDTIFLSPTPSQPSRGWDAKFPRGITWAKLQDNQTRKFLYFFNTHFDYHSRHARDESACLLREEVHKIARDAPYVVTGDFNLFPEMGGHETYLLLTGSQPGKPGKPLIDAQKAALYPHRGPTGTWSGFKEPGQPGIKPDYIFVEPSVRVYQHGVLADTYAGQFPSDHLPVVADLSIP